MEPHSRYTSKPSVDWFALLAGVVVMLVYCFSNRSPMGGYDQPYTMAKLFLDGKFGSPTPIDYLEFVPGNSANFSVFAIGSIIVMLPAALLNKFGLIHTNPATFQIGLIGFFIGYLASRIASIRNINGIMRLSAVLFLAFGNWAWCNIAAGGAPMLSLGYALIGELGAIYWLLSGRSYVGAGAWITLALAHRFELHVLLPIFAIVIFLNSINEKAGSYRIALDRVSAFALIPMIHFALQLAYNLARFGDLFEMGYERIPLVFEQPGFENGLYSLSCFGSNFQVMIKQGWDTIQNFPFFEPPKFGSSILISAPILILLIIPVVARDIYSRVSFVACLTILLALVFHGNTGGWQYGYRYAISCLPWLYLLLLDRAPKAGRTVFISLTLISVAINIYAVNCFYWNT